MLTKTGIEKYFTAEKQESLVFIIIGMVAIVIGLLALLLWKTNGWKGAAIPLLVIGFVQLIAGYTVYAKADAQRIQNVYALDMNPAKLSADELPRMEKVVKNFTIYRWVEIALVVAGIVLFVVYKSNPDKQHLSGLGIALVIQAALMFGGDYVAEQRAKIYTGELKNFIEKNRQ